jgi:hypothetical protein
MKIYNIRLLVVAAAAAITSFVHAAPALDIVATSSGFADRSTAARKVVYNPISEAGSDMIAGQARLSYRVGNAGVTVNIPERDAMHAPAALTYAALVRFDSIHYVSSNPVFLGRWQPAEDDRSAALIFIGENGRLQYLVSGDGTAVATSGGSSKAPLPAGEWLVIVMSWKPGVLSFGLYRPDGTVIEEATLTGVRAPQAMFAGTQPLVMAAPNEFGLQLARLQAHAAFMPTADAARVLLSGR